jgi:hypothetical protein
MNKDFKIEAEALVNQLLNDTPDDELLRLIEEAEEGVYHLCRVPIFCEFTSASTLSANFPDLGTGAFDFKMIAFSKRVNLGDAANYEDLALAA